VKPYNHRELIAAIEALDAKAAGRTVKKLPGGLTLF
jgi:DNA-binding response OmpR family regulator